MCSSGLVAEVLFTKQVLQEGSVLCGNVKASDVEKKSLEK
jgi:hypothetical protein